MKKIVSLLLASSVLMVSCNKDIPGLDGVISQSHSGSFEDNPNGGGGDNTRSVPAAVLATFNSLYPDAANIQWKLLNTGNYKAEFFRGSVRWQAIFTPTGTLVKQEHN